MAVREAEKTLWRALSESRLVAEALNEEGRPTDIPAREWSYLKLFEDGKRDVLRYDALDRREPFTDVKLKRDDLVRLWPPVELPKEKPDPGYLITAEMLEPMANAESAGYVPLCAALHWIMTSAGTRTIRLDDAEGWTTSLNKLRPLICSDVVELIGLRRGGAIPERIPGIAFALVKVLAPLQWSLADITLDAPSHVDCCCFSGEELWAKDFNDRLYETGNAGPTWTHLQVRKADVLTRWPKPAPTASREAACCEWLMEQMRRSPEDRPKSKKHSGLRQKQSFAGFSGHCGFL